MTTPSSASGPAVRDDESFAIERDRADPLARFRGRFEFPSQYPYRPSPSSASRSHPPEDDRCVYLAGNSLGLLPTAARSALNDELDDWSRWGVEGHTHARRPWLPYHELFREPLARLLGALPSEVVAMNSLTVNLNLLLISFYRPTPTRSRILIEDDAFPSDSYALTQHARLHGLDPDRTILRLRPRPGEHTLRTEDIEDMLAREGGSIALVLFGAVSYFTGHFLDMHRVTAAARAAGCVIGWDLAHAAGNVPLRLHDPRSDSPHAVRPDASGPDFAVWCGYKYLNAGPGALAGAFVHHRHHRSFDLPRLAGWWSNDPAVRFRMEKTFTFKEGADGWQVSNPPIFAAAPLKASLDIFDEATMPALREKSVALTAYAESLLRRAVPVGPVSALDILTPADPSSRGCQLSLRIRPDRGARLSARDCVAALRSRGIITDFREPDVVRVAPVPLYNTFRDVFRFVAALREAAL